MKLPRIEAKKLAVGLVITLSGLALVVVLRFTGLLLLVEMKTIDYRFMLRGPLSGLLAVDPIPKDSLDVVIVDLDDETWRLLPYNYPYPRDDIWARSVRNLSRAGAAVIVFDIQFDKQDPNSAIGDSIFAESIREAQEAGTKVVIAAKRVVEKTRIPPDYIALPVPTIMAADPETGLIGELKDADGVTRSMIVFSYLSNDTTAYLSLSLKAIKEYLGYPDEEKLRPVPGGLEYGDIFIPSYGSMNTFLINYYGPPSNAGPPPPTGPWRTFNRYPLSNVVDDAEFTLKEEIEDTDWMELFFKDGFMASIGMAEESPFDGKIVVIGAGLQEFQDVKETPFYNYAGIQQLMPGVETHANAMQTILDQNYIRAIGFKGEMIWLVILSVTAFAFLMWLNPVKGGIISFLLALIYLDVSMGMFFGDYVWIIKKIIELLLPDSWLFEMGNVHMIKVPGYGESVLAPVSTPIAGVMLTYGGNVLYQFIMEQRERKKIKNMFSTYVSPAVLEHLQDNPDAFGLSGQKMNATMFFSDVAGFTTISESLSAEDLAKVLNRYLSPMTEILMSYDGYVDKYEGDAIMCDFGVPVPDPDHHWKACFSALDQQVELSKLREELRNDYNVELYVRMGINSGDVSAGNMGSEQRFQYTVMGDAVNQASRFEGANKQYGTDIMIGESTYQMAKDKIEVRLLDRLVVKGKAVPITVYELIARAGEATDEQLEVVKFFTEGINLHWDRKWDEAIAKFNEALKVNSEDNVSQVYIKRCEQYKISPPPEDWKGEFVMTTK